MLHKQISRRVDSIWSDYDLMKMFYN